MTFDLDVSPQDTLKYVQKVELLGEKPSINEVAKTGRHYYWL